MPKYYVFEISLQEIQPRIWRRILLRTTVGLSWCAGTPGLRHTARLSTLTHRHFSQAPRDSRHDARHATDGEFTKKAPQAPSRTGPSVPESGHSTAAFLPTLSGAIAQ